MGAHHQQEADLLRAECARPGTCLIRIFIPDPLGIASALNDHFAVLTVGKHFLDEAGGLMGRMRRMKRIRAWIAGIIYVERI